MTAPSCSTCDFMRRVGSSMRCFWDVPVPTLIAVVPNRLATMPPIPVVTGMRAEIVDPGNEFCHHHPELRPEGEVRSPGLAEPLPEPDQPLGVRVGSIILPGAGETRQ